MNIIRQNGKCGIYDCDGVRFLFADNTYYAAEFHGVIVSLAAMWSDTIAADLADFAAFCGIHWEGKKSYNDAPYLGENYTAPMTESEIAEAVRKMSLRVAA